MCCQAQTSLTRLVYNHEGSGSVADSFNLSFFNKIDSKSDKKIKLDHHLLKTVENIDVHIHQTNENTKLKILQNICKLIITILRIGL